jgi:hypothetical protein
MCSTGRDRGPEAPEPPWLAEIRRAIDELAADWRASRASAADGRSGSAQAARPNPAGSSDGHAGDLAGRLADIWIMISRADPDLARRLPGYGLPPPRT